MPPPPSSNPQRATPQIEPVEERILYSADAAPMVMVSHAATELAQAIHATALAPSIPQSNAELGAPARELVVVDLGISDAAGLISDLQAQQADGRPVDLLLIETNQDGLSAISAHLAASGEDYAAMHLIGHGDFGAMQLGSSQLNMETMRARAGEIAAWSEHLGNNADLLLYGCDVAASTEGREMVTALAALTSADVAASIDATGNPLLGGNWTLETSTGQIEVALAPSVEEQREWQGLLSLTINNPAADTVVNPAAANQQTTTAGHAGRQAATNTAGQTVVVWTDDTIGVQARLFNASGAATSGAISVSENPGEPMGEPAVAIDADGSFVVVWTDRSGPNDEVHARTFNAAGIASSIEFRVNQFGIGDQNLASVAINPLKASNTDFTVTWTSAAAGSTNLGVMARAFRWDGTAVAAEYAVDSYGTGNQRNSAIAYAVDGTALIVWQSAAQDGSGYGIYGQRLDANGAKTGAEFRINTNTADDQTNPDVAANSLGNFIVVWTRFAGAGDDNDVVGQRVDALGSLAGSEFTVSQTTAKNQSDPAVAVRANGDFVVAWQSYDQDASNTNGIYVRSFRADASASSSETRVNVTSAGDQVAPSVAIVGSRAVVVWSGRSDSSTPTDSNGVFLQQLTLSQPATITVDTTADSAVVDANTTSIAALLANRGADGKISLREAILAANATGNNTDGADRIEFNITDPLIAGAHTISLATNLPNITNAVYIDGATDPDFDGTPVLVLDGSAGADFGLYLQASNSTIRGLVINRFAISGIAVDIGMANTTIIGNYVGTDVTGLLNRGNGSWGIDLYGAGTGTVIGGANAMTGNVIAGNTGLGGIAINSAQSSTIIGNRIGVGADGVTPIGNSTGIYIIGATAGTRIGGTAPGEGNRIANNADEGIDLVSATSFASILGNSIHNNSQQGIDLGDNDTVQPNDAGDSDSGPNGLQNFPSLTSAVVTANTINIVGSIAGATNTNLRLEFFASATGDPLGNGEGQIYLGTINVNTGASGTVSFAPTFSNVSIPAGYRISATATVILGANTYGGTSEFAANISASSAPAGFTVTPTSGLVTTEGAGAASFTFVLDSPPTQNVTIGLTSNSPGEGTPSVSSLTFTPANWNVAQTVTVTGGDDTLIDGDAPYLIITAPAVSTDLNYHGRNASDVVLTNTDDDTTNTLVVNTSSDVADGNTASLVALAKTPGADGKISLREAIMAANATANGIGGPDRINFAITGAGVQTISLSSALPAISDALVIDGYSQTGSQANSLAQGTDVALMIQLSGIGAGAAADGLRIVGSHTTIQGLAISNFGGSGVVVMADDVTLQGNAIGTDATGLSPAGNGVGITQVYGDNLTVGGVVPALRNLISGNIGAGLFMNGGTNQRIAGNLIGTNASGSAAIGNGAEGIVAVTSASNIHIQNNLISGNLSNGIGLYANSGPATVQGNIIGLDAGGSYAIPNMQSGVAIDSSNGNLIGGALAGNVISGNHFEGVYINNSDATAVQGNLIGRSSNNTVTIGNADMGILVEGSSTATLVGGIFANEGNTVAGNSRGVVIRNGSDAGTLLRNVIYDNLSMSIDLADDGPTPNDPLDPDTGANSLQNTPVINQASISGGNLFIDFTLQSEANSYYRVEFFSNPVLDVFGHNEGVQYLGFSEVLTDASGNASATFSIASASATGEYVTATATRSVAGYTSYSDTSELAASTIVNAAPVFTSPTSASVAENLLPVLTLAAIDSDLPAQTLTYAILPGGDSGRFTLSPATHTLSFVVAPNFESPADANADNVYELTVQVTDSLGASTQQAVNVTVTDANEQPVVLTPSALSINENTSVVTNLLANDPDLPAQTISWSIAGGADWSKFTLDAVTGALSFTNPPSADLPGDSDGDNIYQLTVQASDSGGLSTTQALSIIVSGVNSAPTITTPMNISVAEHTLPVINLTATDPDLPAQSLSWSLDSTSDASQFALNSATGELQLLSAADFENPVDAARSNTYALIVRVTDGLGASSAQALNVTIVDVNEAPRITAPASLTTDQDVAVVLAAANGIDLFDPDQLPGSMTVTLTAEHGSFTLATSAGLSFSSGSGNRDRQAVFSGSLVDLKVALASLQFTPDAQFSGQAALDVSIVDNSDAALSDHRYIDITVTPVPAQEPPPAPAPATITPPPTTQSPSRPDSPGSSTATQGRTEADTADESNTSATGKGSQSSASAAVVGHDAQTRSIVGTKASGNTDSAVRSVTAPIAINNERDTARNDGDRGRDRSADAFNDLARRMGIDASRGKEMVLTNAWERNHVQAAAEHSFASPYSSVAARRELLQNIAQMRENMDHKLQFDRSFTASSAAVSASVSIGYVIWLIRGGALLSSLLASIPAWAAIDPVAVLPNSTSRNGDSDDDSLQDMLRKARQARAAAPGLPSPVPESSLPSTPGHYGS